MTMTAATIREALERHYRKPGAPRDGEILIPEVRAPGSNRRADLVRVGMWASRGVGYFRDAVVIARTVIEDSGLLPQADADRLAEAAG